MRFESSPHLAVYITLVNRHGGNIDDISKETTSDSRESTPDVFDLNAEKIFGWGKKYVFSKNWN